MAERSSSTPSLAQLDLRAGFLGLLAMALTLIVAVGLGPGGVTAAVAALIVSAVHPPGGTVARLRSIALMTLIGAGLTAVGVWAGQEGWVAALLVFLVTLSATFASAYGSAWAAAGYLLNLWVLLALVLSASDHGVALMAGAFLAGGAAAALVALLPIHRRAEGEGSAPTDGAEPAAVEAGPDLPRGTPSLDAELSRFALVRAVTAGVTTLVGWYLFDAHPYWAVLTAFVIIKTEAEASIRLGVQRTVGTAFGVLVGVVLVQSIHGTGPLIAVFAVSAFLMMAVKETSYAAYSFFVTLVLLAASRIAAQDVPTAGVQRLAATALGAGAAIAVIWLTSRMAARRPGGRDAQAS